MRREKLLLFGFIILLCFVAKAQNTQELCCENAAYGENITDLEVALKNPENVYFLDLALQDIKLTKIPNEVTTLVNLVCLDVSYNRIGSFPADFTKLTKLTCLDLSGNHYLAKLPTFLNDMPGLKIIKLEGLNWSEDRKEKTRKEFPHITFIW